MISDPRRPLLALAWWSGRSAERLGKCDPFPSALGPRTMGVGNAINAIKWATGVLALADSAAAALLWCAAIASPALILCL